jgi:hypothetical protein
MENIVENRTMKKLFLNLLVWTLTKAERLVVTGWSFVDWLESPDEADEIEIFVSGPVEKIGNSVHIPRHWRH